MAQLPQTPPKLAQHPEPSLCFSCCWLEFRGERGKKKKRCSGGLPLWKEEWEGDMEAAVTALSALTQRVKSGWV